MNNGFCKLHDECATLSVNFCICDSETSSVAMTKYNRLWSMMGLCKTELMLTPAASAASPTDRIMPSSAKLWCVFVCVGKQGA